MSARSIMPVAHTILGYGSHEMKSLPSIVCIVTGEIGSSAGCGALLTGCCILGKGPLKEQFIDYDKPQAKLRDKFAWAV